MGTINIYEALTEAWDNGPGSYGDDSDEPDPTIVSNTLDYRGAGLLVFERTTDGITTRVATRTEYLSAFYNTLPEGSGVYLTEIITYKNGEVGEHWQNFLIHVANAQIYEGDLYGEYVYQYNDNIYGSSKSETIYGYEGDDVLDGGSGDDYLHGGNGYDMLFGGAGNDILTASSEVDGLRGNYYSGGSGTDTVVLGGNLYDYAITKLPYGNITMTWETGFKVATISHETEFIQLNDIKVDTSDLVYIGEVLNRLTTSPNAVHRFYNNRDKAFFYTASSSEKDYVLNASAYERPDDSEWPYVYQGSTFEVASSYSSQVPLFRFYNTKTGHHFFTVNPDERDLVIAKSNSGDWPFNYEGIAFNVYAGDPNPSFVGEEIPVHRFYNPTLDRHFYTGSESEANLIQLIGQWNYEGIGFFGEII